MRGLAFLLLLALAGCGDAKKMWRESEIQEIAGNAADAEATMRRNQEQALWTRVEAMEARLKAVEEKTGFQEAYAAAISKDLDTVADQVSGNAKVANENALAEMNRRNACYPRKCTMKDLQP